MSSSTRCPTILTLRLVLLLAHHFFVETKSETSTYVGIRISEYYLSTFIKNKSGQGLPPTTSPICKHPSASVQQSIAAATSGQLRSTSHLKHPYGETKTRLGSYPRYIRFRSLETLKHFKFKTKLFYLILLLILTIQFYLLLNTITIH